MIEKHGRIMAASIFDGASDETVQRYFDYREEGYSPIQARLMSGLSDPEMEGLYTGEDDES